MFPVVIVGTHCFLPCLFVGLLDNFNIGHKFWTLSDRAFIFGKGIPLIQKILTSYLDFHLWPTLKKN